MAEPIRQVGDNRQLIPRKSDPIRVTVEIGLSPEGVAASIEAYYRWQDSGDFRTENLARAFVRAALTGASVRLLTPHSSDQPDKPDRAPESSIPPMCTDE